MDEPRQLLEFAQQFFSIANTITAFSVFQALALMYAFKDAKLAAAFLRWRPYTSLLAKHAGNGYIIAVISCGIAEFCLRYVAYEPRAVAMLGACVLAVMLRCAAIYLIASVYLQMFVAVCREQNWLNKNQKDGREFQIPRILPKKRSKSDERVRKVAMKVDEKLFKGEVEVVQAEHFD
jgi:hypothetical protein